MYQYLGKAIELVSVAHQDQFYGTEPYICHILRVVNRMDTIEQKIVAMLHDVIEDTPVTKEVLIEMGFPNNIVNAVEAISKIPGETYDDYLSRLCYNKLALQVKIADMTDNYTNSLRGEPNEKTAKRVAKYSVRLPKLKSEYKRLYC